MTEPNLSNSRLSWRIPIPHENSEFRRGALRVLLATTICLCVVYVFGGEMRMGGLIGTLCFAAVAFGLVYWRAAHAVANRKDNVWLDKDGLHWTNEHQGHGTLPAEEMQSFHIGPDAETPDSLKSLTFQLGENRTSQPIPLHDPATPEKVRNYLLQELQVTQQEQSTDQQRSDLRQAVEASLHEQPPGEATELLQFALLPTPERRDAGWLLFQQNEFGQVYFNPVECTFEHHAPGEQQQTLPTLKKLLLAALDFLEALSVERRTELLETAAESLNHRFREALKEQIAHAGFYSECDDVNATWTFSGAREKLLALPRVLRQVAEMQPPIAGERPPRIEIASAPMPVVVQLEEFAWFGGGIICGPAHRLSALADSIEERIEATSTGKRCKVEPPNDAAEPWQLHFEVQAEDFQPATVAQLDP